jgi:hypothetical protein
MDIMLKPEYIALIISVVVPVVTISANLWIDRVNRKHTLAKEEYFKLKQVVERIIAKIAILENQREKLIVFVENRYKASQDPDSEFFDENNTFDKTDFEKNSGEIAALLDVYFEDLGGEWNHCLDLMGRLFTHVYKLNLKIADHHKFDWKSEVDGFERLNSELHNKPKELSDILKMKLKEYKEKNL